MDAELIIEKMKQDVAEREREYVYLRSADAKQLIEKINSLERLVADLLRLRYANRMAV